MCNPLFWRNLKALFSKATSGRVANLIPIVAMFHFAVNFSADDVEAGFACPSFA
jgi:hypothetical protein